MRSYSSHLGARVSALVDGQLAAAELDRAWRHVLGCPACRAEVEHEVWLKRRLASLHAPGPADDLADALSRLPYAAPPHHGPVVPGWSTVVHEERPHRRPAVLLLGVGAASVVAAMGWGLSILVDETGSAPAGAGLATTPSVRPTPVGAEPGAPVTSQGLPAPLR